MFPLLGFKTATFQSSQISTIPFHNLLIVILLRSLRTQIVPEPHTFPALIIPLRRLFQRFLHLLLPRKLTVS